MADAPRLLHIDGFCLCILNRGRIISEYRTGFEQNCTENVFFLVVPSFFEVVWRGEKGYQFGDLNFMENDDATSYLDYRSSRL